MDRKMFFVFLIVAVLCAGCNNAKKQERKLQESNTTKASGFPVPATCFLSSSAVKSSDGVRTTEFYDCDKDGLLDGVLIRKEMVEKIFVFTHEHRQACFLNYQALLIEQVKHDPVTCLDSTRDVGHVEDMFGQPRLVYCGQPIPLQNYYVSRDSVAGKKFQEQYASLIEKQ